MAAASLVAVSPVRGDPGDIFQTSAPAIGAATPKGADIAGGDASVSTQTGALTYAYPIKVPPGRNGAQPSLALSYSSQAAIYGGIAAGWSLSGLHMIQQDTTDGRINGVVYQSSLSGGRPLVQVTDNLGSGSYRAKNDSSWTRYQLLGDSPTNAKWVAYTADGTKWNFGEPGESTCTGGFSTTYAPLTSTVDKFGNTVTYTYAGGPDGECRINYITWGQNPGASLSQFATVKFNWAEMPVSTTGVYIGSQVSWRTGVKRVTGSSRLLSMTVVAYTPGLVSGGTIPAAPDHRRTVTLSYDTSKESCTARHAPFRQLASIQETAIVGADPATALPAVTFEYGDTALGAGTLAWPTTPAQSAGAPWSSLIHQAGGAANNNLSWGYRFFTARPPTVEAMMVDLDGDGLLDRLINDPERDATNTKVVRCRARWARNTGTGSFVEIGEIKLPTLKWAGTYGTFQGGAFANPVMESCSLNYQQTSYVNSLNINGSLVCPGNTACPATGFCQTGGYDCEFKYEQTPSTTVLAYRWMDMDGDGLVDLVASPTKGGPHVYNFYQGTHPSAPVESPLVFGNLTCPSTNYALPAVMSGYTMCDGKYPWFFYKNYGNNTFGETGATTWPQPTRVLYQPMPLESAGADSSITSLPVGSNQGTVDIDGDGDLDGLATAGSSWTSWQVWSNDQTSAEPGRFMPFSASVPYMFPIGNSHSLHKTGLSALTYNAQGLEGLFDIHGDGLPEHWTAYAGTNFKINDGIQLRTVAGTGEINTTVTPSTDGRAYIPPGCWDCYTTGAGGQSGTVLKGYRFDASRPLDLDLDGRVDVIRENTSLVKSSYFNLGGAFGGAAPAIGVDVPLGRRIAVGTNPSTIGLPPGWPTGPTAGVYYTWEVRSDMLDLDGDGIPEGIEFDASNGSEIDGLDGANRYKVYEVTTPTSPPRLLKRIDNGRGASTSFEYAPVASVPRAAGKRMPQTQWVVTKQVTSDTLASPTTLSTTTYSYADPEYIADDTGHFGFRGFDKVTTTLPSGATREETYSFSPDWSGRLAKAVTRSAEAPSSVHTIDLTT